MATVSKRSGPPVVVDTNVVSYIYNRSELGRRYELLLGPFTGYIASVTLTELYFGPDCRRWGTARWERLNEVLGAYAFLPATAEAAKLAGHIRAQRKHIGRPIRWRDAYIAAVAVTNHFPLITHDRDFSGIDGLEILTELSSVTAPESVLPLCDEAGLTPSVLATAA